MHQGGATWQPCARIDHDRLSFSSLVASPWGRDDRSEALAGAGTDAGRWRDEGSWHGQCSEKNAIGSSSASPRVDRSRKAWNRPSLPGTRSWIRPVAGCLLSPSPVISRQVGSFSPADPSFLFRPDTQPSPPRFSPRSRLLVRQESMQACATRSGRSSPLSRGIQRCRSGGSG